MSELDSKDLKVSICVTVKESSMGQPVVESLNPIPVNVILGKSISFSRMINEVINASASSDILIICSHRVRPKPEDVYKIIPDLVSLDADGKPHGIKYTKLTAYLLEAIKSLNKEINLLKKV
jgi:hypothetical protein